VVGTAGVLDAAAEAVDEERALGVIVGLAVAVLILELGEEGRVDEIEDATDEVATARALDLGIFDDLVGTPAPLVSRAIRMRPMPGTWPSEPFLSEET
jgi:hypothetical protein